jgi:hypothetical protein
LGGKRKRKNRGWGAKNSGNMRVGGQKQRQKEGKGSKKGKKY